jgi:ribonuclease VapC
VILDTSALIAILWDEAEREAFNEAVAQAAVRQMSTATLADASIVIEASRGYDGLRDFDLWIAAAGVELVPVDADQAQIAREAFRRYGKGHGPAGLNFGDCFSYALSKATGLPLLFKGDDFPQTDVESAI